MAATNPPFGAEDLILTDDELAALLADDPDDAYEGIRDDEGIDE